MHIELTKGSVNIEPLDKNLARRFIGGRGINSRILYNEVGPEVDPLSPRNVLIFGTSPITGTSAPSSPRCTVSAKSPLTGILGDANFGGFFSCHLKRAGFDHVVIRGKAERPVFLYVHDGKAEIREAHDLWGKTTDEAETTLKNQLTEKKIHTACIGPAGENMVRTTLHCAWL